MKKQTAESFKQQNKGKRSAAPKLRCVDLFCGCGGMSLGFEKAGYDVKAGFELWEPAMRMILHTRVQNLSWSHFRAIMRVADPTNREWNIKEEGVAA